MNDARLLTGKLGTGFFKNYLTDLDGFFVDPLPIVKIVQI